MAKILREATLILVMVLVVGTFMNFLPRRHLSWWGQGQEPPKAGKDFQPLDCDSANAMRESLPQVIFVDTRTEEEYWARHIPGALRLELQSLGDMLSADMQQQLAQAEAVVIYGASEETDVEQLLAQALRRQIPQMPIPYVLIGGVQVWEAAGFPLEGQS